MNLQRQSGFGFVELAVSIALLACAILSVTSLLQTGSSAHDQARRMRKLTELAQGVTDEVRTRMVSSTRVYGNDAAGNAMLALLDLSHAPQRIGVRRLPTIDIDGSFRADRPTDQITGNALLFSYLAWRDAYECLSGKEYLVEVYRVVHYYLSPIGAGPSEQVPGGLDLVRFVSEPLVDADSIAAIADPADRAEVLMHLCNATPDAEGSVREAVQVVWQRTSELGVPGTLRQIDPTNGLLSDSIIPGTGRASAWRVHPGRETAAGEFSLRRAAVASNFDDCPQADGRFAVPDLAQGFPHGFEVQVVGPTSSRKVLMRLVLVDTTQGKLPVWNEFQTILPAHAR